MLEVIARWVKPGQEQRLRDWLTEVQGPRRDEALVTLAEEGCRHEVALLVQTSDGPLLVYAMEVDDWDKARAVAATSRHAIDREHKEVMTSTLGERASVERLLDLRAE